MRTNLSDLKPNNKLYNMRTHEISNRFFKSHGKCKFKIPKIKKEGESSRLNANELKNLKRKTKKVFV